MLRRPQTRGRETRKLKPPPLITLAAVCFVAAACALSAPLLLGRASAREDASPTARVALRVDPNPALSSGVQLLTLPWGAGVGEVGLSTPSEGLVQGPEALAAAEDGRLAILDSVNRRVLLLDSSGQPSGTIPLDLASPRFLAVTADAVCVLDADNDHRVAVWDWAGSRKFRQDIPETDDPVTALIARADGLFLETGHRDVTKIPLEPSSSPESGLTLSGERDQTAAGNTPTGRGAPVAGRPIDRAASRFAQATFARGGHPTLNLLRSGGAAGSKDTDVDLLTTQSLEHLISLDGDGRGGVILGAKIHRQQSAGCKANSTLLLMRMTPESVAPGVNPSTSSATTGAEVQALRLSDSGFAYLGQPYTVGPDGRVYQPVASERGYSILVHTFPDGGEK